MLRKRAQYAGLLSELINALEELVSALLIISNALGVWLLGAFGLEIIQLRYVFLTGISDRRLPIRDTPNRDRRSHRRKRDQPTAIGSRL